MVLASAPHSWDRSGNWGRVAICASMAYFRGLIISSNLMVCFRDDRAIEQLRILAEPQPPEVESGSQCTSPV